MRKSEIAKLAIVIAVLCVTWGAAISSDAQAVGPPRAVVQAVQGDASVTADLDREPTKLAVGSMVAAWNTVSTDENSKLFLKWETGMLNSIGGSSSIFLAPREDERGPVDAIEMTAGLLRVTRQGGAGSVAPYMVVTPAASIEPVNYDEPVDFIVEVYIPATSTVTVLSGSVKVTNLTLSQPTETVLSPCQTVYVEEGKPKLEPLASSSEDLGRLVNQTTISGTIAANLEACPITSPQPRGAEARVSPGTRYAESPNTDYEYEELDSEDFYPYNNITVLPPEPGVGSVVMLPGVGRWIIPMDVFTDWRFDPAVVGIYCRRIILDNIIYGDQYYLTDLRLRQRQFRDMVYLAQLSGNRSMLWDAQRQLADVNIQEHWAHRRLNSHQRHLTGLDQEQHKFADKLPRGRNMLQAVSNSFNSPKNLKVVQGFRDKMRTDLNVQGQLAGLAGKELTDMRSRVARERDPQKRLALRDELSRINQNVDQGKFPIPGKQPQVKQVVERLAKEQDPKKVQDLQKQLGRLTRTDSTRTADPLTKDNFASLTKGLEKFPNAQKRQDLQAHAVQLRQSVQERQQAVLTGEKIDHITTKAANETDVVKRNEFVRQLKELEKTPTAGSAARLNLLGQRQNLESQLSIEQDHQKRAVLEKALQDQRKKHSELPGQQLERAKQPEGLSEHKEDLKKQTEHQRLEQDRQKQTEQKHLQQQQVEKEHKQQQQQGEQRQHQQEQVEQSHRQQQRVEKEHKQQQHQQAEQSHRQQQPQQQQRQAPQVQQQQHREQPQQRHQQAPQQQQRHEERPEHKKH